MPVLASIVNMQYSPAAVSASPSPRKLAVIRELDGFLARHCTAHFMAITEAARQSAQEALRIDPSCAEAWCLAGEIYRWANDLERAEDAYRKASKLAPGERRAVEGLRTVLLARKKA